MDPTQLSQLLSSLGGLASAGLGTAGANQSYGTLQKALQTIGPTQLGNFSLAGPAGGGSFNLQNGTGALDYGALNPAFGNLATAGASGSGGYNAGLIPGLTSTANSTLSPALSSLLSAYGSNSGLQGAAMQQANGLNNTYNSIYGNTLSSLQALQQPGVQQQAFGLQNTLFGNGTLNSSGAASGALAAGNFGSQVNAMNAQDALSAQQQALSGMQGQAGIASTLSGAGNNLLTSAFNNFGNTNQLISGLNTAGLTNSLSALQGAGGINTIGLNNYNTGLQTSLAGANARNGSLFPYAMTANALANANNPLTNLGNLLTNSNGTGLISSLFGNGQSGNGLINQLGGLFGNNNVLSSLLGPNGNAGVSNLTGLAGNDLGGMYYGAGTPQGTPNGFNSGGSFSMPTYSSGDTSGYYGDNSTNLPTSFNGAGGQAATSAAFPTNSIDPGSINAGPAPNFDLGQGQSSSSSGLGFNSLGSVYGAYSGLASGNPVGQASGALNVASLANRAGLFGSSAGSVGSALGTAAPILGLYSGLSSGTPQGYASAATSAAQLGSVAASAAGDTGLAAGLGAVGNVAVAPAMVYGIANLFQMLDPDPQMTPQQIAAVDNSIPYSSQEVASRQVPNTSMPYLPNNVLQAYGY